MFLKNGNNSRFKCLTSDDEDDCYTTTSIKTTTYNNSYSIYDAQYNVIYIDTPIIFEHYLCENGSQTFWKNNSKKVISPDCEIEFDKFLLYNITDITDITTKSIVTAMQYCLYDFDCTHQSKMDIIMILSNIAYYNTSNFLSSKWAIFFMIHCIDIYIQNCKDINISLIDLNDTQIYLDKLFATNGYLKELNKNTITPENELYISYSNATRLDYIIPDTNLFKKSSKQPVLCDLKLLKPILNNTVDQSNDTYLNSFGKKQITVNNLNNSNDDKFELKPGWVVLDKNYKSSVHNIQTEPNNDILCNLMIESLVNLHKQETYNYITLYGYDIWEKMFVSKIDTDINVGISELDEFDSETENGIDYGNETEVNHKLVANNCSSDLMVDLYFKTNDNLNRKSLLKKLPKNILIKLAENLQIINDDNLELIKITKKKLIKHILLTKISIFKLKKQIHELNIYTY